MVNTKGSNRMFSLLLASIFFGWLALASGASAGEQEDQVGQEMTFDNLVRVKDSRVETAFIDPEADFSFFNKIMVMTPNVAFRSNWLRDQNRSRTRNISNKEVENIKAEVATLFEKVFTERLQEAGYFIADGAGDDVMVIRPSIIDLDITAPDVGTAGRSRTFTSTSGAATLYIEIFDSHTGDIIGSAADRRTVRRHGDTLSWTNSVINKADAQRVFGRWADQLVGFLDEHYK